MRIISLINPRRLSVAACAFGLLLGTVACRSSDQPAANSVPAEAMTALVATVPASPTILLPTTPPALSPSPTGVRLTGPTAEPNSEPTQLSYPLPTSILTTPTMVAVVARIIEIIDGDSMVVELSEGRQEISYWGCAVPEGLSDWQAEQCASANRVLLSCGQVRLEPDPLAEIMGVARYNVWDGDTLLNAELVRLGYARADRLLAGSRYEKDILDNQALAQNAGLGIWASPPEPTTAQPAPATLPTHMVAPNGSETTSPEPTITVAPTATVAAEPSATPEPTETKPTEPTPAPAATPPLPSATEPTLVMMQDTATPTDTPPHTPTPLPAPTTVPTSPATGTVDVAITDVFFDGVEGRAEPDEYCEITNQGDSLIDMAGWRLNAGANGQDFVFPDMVLEPGNVCRVYTNELHDEWGGLSFGSGQALWRNSGDCGYLYDSEGIERDAYCYD